MNTNTELNDLLEWERKDKLKQIAAKDRDKVQTTDKLKKDMLTKI